MYSNKAWYILDSKKTFVLTIRDEIILRNSWYYVLRLDCEVFQSCWINYVIIKKKKHKNLEPLSSCYKPGGPSLRFGLWLEIRGSIVGGSKSSLLRGHKTS